MIARQAVHLPRHPPVECAKRFANYLRTSSCAHRVFFAQNLRDDCAQMLHIRLLICLVQVHQRIRFGVKDENLHAVTLYIETPAGCLSCACTHTIFSRWALLGKNVCAFSRLAAGFSAAGRKLPACCRLKAHAERRQGRSVQEHDKEQEWRR